MLNKLYRKLYVIFVCGMILIISIIAVIILNNHITTEQNHDLSYAQRMSTLIIYQLENNSDDFENVIKDYEQQCDIFCAVKNEAGEIIYQSKSSFPTSEEFLLSALDKQSSSFSSAELKKQKNVTEQDGAFVITGQNEDIYWGIPAIVISRDNNIYHLALLYKSQTASELLCRQAPLYTLVWFASLMCVVFLGHLILKQAFKPTEQILNSQKDFIASASHELKSPLAVLLANVEKLGKLDIDNHELNKSVEVMNKECVRMSQLVSDMLLLASSDAKFKTTIKKEVNVDTLLISLYEKYETICAKHNVLLDLKISDVSYPPIYSDPELIIQILCIFMDNAISHSDGSPSIQIQTSLTAKSITFYVVDHGRGISVQDEPFVFNRFYCADKSHTDKSHFGLGLSIAYELASMLHGKVGFNDTYGGGATFYLTIPIK